MEQRLSNSNLCLVALTLCVMIIAGCGGGGGQTCTSHATKVCYNNDVYWYDSCGSRQDVYQSCGAGLTCSDSQCMSIWSKTFGGTQHDIAEAVRQTSDGGYIVAGYTISYSAGENDFWILKLDSAGEQTWAKAFGGVNMEWAFDIQQTSDGGYIVVGETRSYGAGGADFWVLKLDPYGEKTWDKTYGGTEHDFAHAVQQTSDGGYIVAGPTNSYGAGSTDFWILKLDSSGEQTWAKTYGGATSDTANDIQQTVDGGYVVAGQQLYPSSGFSQIWVLKLSSSGDQIWEKTVGVTLQGEAEAIRQTSDGGYVVAGYVFSVDTNSIDLGVFKLDSSGEQIWEKTYGGSKDDFAYDIQQTSDGGYVVVGKKTWVSGYSDLWILKLDSSGELIWEKSYGGTRSDRANSIQQTSDGGYIVGGYIVTTELVADVWVLKLDPNGKYE